LENYNGGKYAFANILSNPNINKLVVLVFEHDDNGHLLVDSLRQLWKEGVDKDGIIKNCNAPNPKFEGINNEALKILTRQADLIILKNIKDLSLPEKIIKANIQEPENAVKIDDNIEFYSNYSEKRLFYDCGARFEEPYKVDFSSATEK